MCHLLSSLSVQTYHLLSPQLKLLFFITAVTQLVPIYAVKIPILLPGSSTRGTTSGAPHLINVETYRNGQALFEVLVQPQRRGNVLSVSTCSTFTSFDTVLYAFSSNPLNINAPPRWINKNDNDCGLQSTIQVRVSIEASLYFLLTGYRGEEGDYDVQVEEIVDRALPMPWGLDRIDQRLLPLDGQFSIKEAGQRVFIYILDSGVRASHKEFLRSDGTSRVIYGQDFVERLDAVVDESGHGTHVAALAAGKSFGVAKKAIIVSVRVLDRTNAGLISQLVDALEWTRSDIYRKNTFPAIVVMSLSTSVSEILNDAVAKVTSAGIAVVAAAGNDGKNSCLASPASEKSALTVGATNHIDQVSIVSNWGECVTIYAPGEGILSAWHTGDSATKQLSGTSVACPLVAGAAAILLEQNPLLKPDEIREVIFAMGSLSVKENDRFAVEPTKEENSPGDKPLRRMLYVRSIPAVLRDGRPPESKMFLYVIFGLASERKRQQHCYLTDEHVSSARIVLSSLFGDSMKTSVDLNMCCHGHVNSGCDDGSVFPGNRLVARVVTRDSYAYSAFESLSAFCQDKKGAVSQLRTALGMNVSVAAEPWVLDSRGYKYWAAPALIHTANRGLSSTQVVGIVSSITLSALCLIATTLCLIQSSKRKRRQKDQDYFEEKATEYEVEKKRHASLRNPEDLNLTPVYSQGISRINSELQGDILKCLSPSGVLPTPTAPGPSAARALHTLLASPGTKRGRHPNLFSDSGEAPVVHGRADRSHNMRALPEKTQASASLFTRLWTPRGDRTTATSTSSRGRSHVRGLPRIVSFGPERGAIVQPTLPSPAESEFANTITEGGAEQDETIASASQTCAPSEKDQI